MPQCCQRERGRRQRGPEPAVPSFQFRLKTGLLGLELSLADTLNLRKRLDVGVNHLRSVTKDITGRHSSRCINRTSDQRSIQRVHDFRLIHGMASTQDGGLRTGIP